MATYKTFVCADLIITTQVFAGPKMDNEKTINGVFVQSGKDDSTRIYRGVISKILPFKIDTVKNSIVNFQEKCNNKLKDKRRFTDKKTDCKYHNDNLVETLIVKNIKASGWSKAPGEVERYVLGRQVYNRGSFGYYEVVQIFDTKNAQNQRTLKIVQTMLDDKDVKTYTSPKFEKDSAFNHSTATFTLTEIGPKETNFEYEYKADTEHWILNKEVSVPQVFASISKSINDLVKTVDAESVVQSRDVASN